MLILHLSWEYPPLVYGGLGRHVHALAEAQAAAGHEVLVITQTEGEPVDEVVNGVRVIRSRRDPPALPLDNDHLLAWVSGLEHGLTRSVIRLAEEWRPDVIHAHDWVVAHVAAAASARWNRPLVTTFHATEAGRHQGWVPQGLPLAVHSTEWWLGAQSTRVITCSKHMKREVNRLSLIDSAATDVIPNGIDAQRWQANPADVARARKTYGRGGPVLVYTGRLEWEKGVQTLLDAMPEIRRQHPTAHLVIAGKGGMADDLKKRAKHLRILRRVSFAGWLPEVDLHALVAAADVAIVPSLYEPFGLVALEAAALGTPIVVSDTGGLGEFAQEGRVALTFERENASVLASQVCSSLSDSEATADRVRVATAVLAERYTWDLVADQTVATYETAVQSYAISGQPPRPGTPPPPADGNLLSDLEN